MENPSIAPGRETETEIRVRLEGLRRQVYNQADPARNPELLEALIQAELELERIVSQPEPAEEGGLLLDTAGKGEKSGGVMMGMGANELEIKVFQRMDYIPTGIVHLLDPKLSPLVSFKLIYSGDQIARLRLRSFVEGYSAHAIDTVRMDAEHTEVEVPQMPTFFPANLEPLHEMTRATLHVRIDDLDGRTRHHSTFPIWLLPRTTARTAIKDVKTGRWTSLVEYLAAWVTPNAPTVMDLLRKAADASPDLRSLSGYQAELQGVEAQVQAIYQAVRALDIRYINSVLCSGGEKDEQIQRVRLPSESIANRSANCIDGTVLLASLLEAASLNPALVIVPSHAFLAWETCEGRGEWDFLETTMLGKGDFPEAQRSGRAQAAKWRAMQTQSANQQVFCLQPVRRARLSLGIVPME